MCSCYSAMISIKGWGEVWCHIVVEWLYIQYGAVGCSRRMGAPIPLAFMSSHTGSMDGMSIPVAVVPTSIHYPTWTLEASSPTDHVLESNGCMAIGA